MRIEKPVTKERQDGPGSRFALRKSGKLESEQFVPEDDLMPGKKRKPAAKDATDYEEEVLKSLRAIIRAIDLYSRELMADHGLSGPQLLCLSRLSKGKLLSGSLANELSLSPATVSGILDRLEARGLVARERQEDDKRTVIVSLTAEGRRLVRRAPPPLDKGFLKKLRRLPAMERAEIAATLKKVAAMMAKP